MPKTILNRVRQIFYRLKMKKHGVLIYNNTIIKNVNFLGSAKIEPYCRIIGDSKIVIGSDFYINSDCHLYGEITIGENVMIGPKTIIWGRDHGMALDMPMNKQKHNSSPILIGDDVWIGARVTILKGVKIGNGVVVGAGSLVTKDIPDFAVVIGNPAKIIKFRK